MIHLHFDHLESRYIYNDELAGSGKYIMKNVDLFVNENKPILINKPWPHTMVGDAHVICHFYQRGVDSRTTINNLIKNNDENALYEYFLDYFSVVKYEYMRSKMGVHSLDHVVHSNDFFISDFNKSIFHRSNMSSYIYNSSYIIDQYISDDLRKYIKSCNVKLLLSSFNACGYCGHLRLLKDPKCKNTRCVYGQQND